MKKLYVVRWYEDQRIEKMATVEASSGDEAIDRVRSGYGKRETGETIGFECFDFVAEKMEPSFKDEK